MAPYCTLNRNRIGHLLTHISTRISTRINTQYAAFWKRVSWQGLKKENAFRTYFLEYLGYLEVMLEQAGPFILGDKVMEKSTGIHAPIT